MHKSICFFIGQSILFLYHPHTHHPAPSPYNLQRHSVAWHSEYTHHASQYRNRRFGQAHHHNGGIHITDRHTRNIDVTKFGVRSLFGSAGILLYFRLRTIASFLILLITILLTRISSTMPPRPRVDFRRIPRSVPSKTQLLMVTFFTPHSSRCR